jgi:hypothetical protein
MIEARDDTREPRTGKYLNYGIVRFNPAAGSILMSRGDIIASGVDVAANGWLKIWADLQSTDGRMFVLIGLLGGRSPTPEFRAAGQEVTFGGFEISPSSTTAFGHVADIGDLPAAEDPSAQAGRGLVKDLRILGSRSRGVGPGMVYRVAARIKSEEDVDVIIEARDSPDIFTGKPSNHGVVRFNLATRSVVSSIGEILANGVETTTDGWIRLWAGLRSKDGQVFASFGVLDGSNHRRASPPVDRELSFGGLEIRTLPDNGTP